VVSGSPDELGGVGAVPLDQRVRQLPLRAGKSDAVPFEFTRACATLAEILASPGELGRALHQHLDACMASAALEACRATCVEFRSVHEHQYRHESGIDE